jgi:MFS family permease
LGSLIGFLTVASIADRFGRILAIKIAWGAFTVGVLLMLVAKSGWMLGIAIFLEGYGSVPGTASSFSIIQESCLN